MKEGLLAFLFSPWGWLSLAAVAAGLEILLPGAYMIWFAAAALGTAITAAILNLTIDGQLGAFAFWILLALLASRKLKLDRPGVSDDPLLNRRGERLAGSIATVTQEITGGRGRVRVGDGEWLAEGPDTPEGARVVVTGSNGAVLTVERAVALPAG